MILLNMGQAVFVFACLACEVHGRRVQVLTERVESRPVAQPETRLESYHTELRLHRRGHARSIATNLLCLLLRRSSPSSAFQASCLPMRRSVFNPRTCLSRMEERSRTHSDRMDAVMALETELLFSGSRSRLEVQYPCTLALVQASLEEKLRPKPSGGDSSLDSASADFEALLARLRKAAGFAEATPWREPSEMPWAKDLTEITPILQSELAAARGVALEWESASYEAIAPDWRVIHLWQNGQWLDDAERLFPESVVALRELMANHGLRLNRMQNVACGIARLPAGSAISPHCDGNVLGLTCHLGLVVPPAGCTISVGGETRSWAEGELLLFDTTFTHSVENISPQDRFILMLNVLRPGVDEHESAALQRHLAAPSFRLDSINPFYVWLPAIADGENDDDRPLSMNGISFGRARAGDIFVAASAAIEVAPNTWGIEVSPSCWLPLRGRGNESRRAGLSLVVPMSDQTFTTVSPAQFRSLPSYEATAIDGQHLDEGKHISPTLGLVDNEGLLLWIGCWHDEAASLMRPSTSSVLGDEFDVPVEVLQQHISLLREPLDLSSKWLPMDTQDGKPLLREHVDEKPAVPRMNKGKPKVKPEKQLSSRSKRRRRR